MIKQLQLNYMKDKIRHTCRKAIWYSFWQYPLCFRSRNSFLGPKPGVKVPIFGYFSKKNPKTAGNQIIWKMNKYTYITNVSALLPYQYPLSFRSINPFLGPKPGVKVSFFGYFSKKIIKRRRQSTNMKKELMHTYNKCICFVSVSILTTFPVNKFPFGAQTGGESVLFRIF